VRVTPAINISGCAAENPDARPGRFIFFAFEILKSSALAASNATTANA
jgi:hypothetical protein